MTKIAFWLAIFLGVLVLPIKAQEVLTKTSLSGEINTLLNTYNGQFQEYQKAEKDYQLAFSQNVNLDTLNSLNVLLAATKEAQGKRTQLLSTYFQLLKVRLVDTQGINIEQKNRAKSALDQHLSFLTSHSQKITNTNDRAGLVATDAELSTALELMSLNATYAESLIQLGKVNNIYDSEKSLYESLKSVPKNENLNQTQLNNSQDELDSRLSRISASLFAMSGQLDEDYERERLQDLTKDLIEIHGELLQTINLISEYNRLYL